MRQSHVLNVFLCALILAFTSLAHAISEERANEIMRCNLSARSPAEIAQCMLGLLGGGDEDSSSQPPPVESGTDEESGNLPSEEAPAPDESGFFKAPVYTCHIPIFAYTPYEASVSIWAPRNYSHFNVWTPDGFAWTGGTGTPGKGPMVFKFEGGESITISPDGKATVSLKEVNSYSALFGKPELLKKPLTGRCHFIPEEKRSYMDFRR